MVIKNGMVVTENGIQNVDVLIENGKIAKIAPNLSGERVVDAKGRYVMPALVDIGSRVLDGKIRAGTLKDLSKKAQRNGFAKVALSALCEPRIDSEVALEFAKSQFSICDGADICSLVAGIREDGRLSDISILLKDGAMGIEFSSDTDGNMVRRMMEYALMHDVRLFCHADDTALHGDGVMHEGKVSARLGLSGVPAVAESSQVARIGELADFYGVNVVVLGASTPQTLRICQQNPWLHSQVSLHHLLLTDDACDNYNTAGKIWPPLRDTLLRDLMQESLARGGVSMLTSLHTPVSRSAKDAVFAEAAYGIDGMENFLPLCYTYLVESGIVSMEKLIDLVATKPAAAAGFKDRIGKIEIGYDAKIVIFDPAVKSCIESESSPYFGRAIYGKIEIVSG
ncbi:amidohydrolase family protein [Hydrogenimonas sp.]